MDFGQHFLAAFEATPSNISSVPFALKVFIMGHIIMGTIINVNRNSSPNQFIVSGHIMVILPMF